MSALFDSEFRQLLHRIVHSVRGLRGRRGDDGRSRRRWVATSGTFVGHRPYAAGEDLRRLDWNAYARSGELQVKVLEEEQRRTLTILLDSSGSMEAGLPARFDGTRRLVAVIGAAALARLDGVHLVTTDKIAHLSGASDIESLLKFLERLRPDGGGSGELVRAMFGARVERGRVCWMSDFPDVEECEEGLRLLRPRRQDVLGILPLTDEDSLPPVDGYVKLVDPERGRREQVRVDRSLRRVMEEELANLSRARRGAFGAAGIRLLEFQLPPDRDLSPASWMAGGWAKWI